MFIDIKSIKSTKTTIIMLGLLFIIPFILYFPSLSYDFLYELDDDWIVINNPSIKMISNYGLKKGLKYLFYYDTTDFHYHPITYLSYSIDYYFFGINLFEIKLHNLLLHISAGLLVFAFIQLIVNNKWIAFAVALLFLIHPMNIESVAWASCRRQSLFFTFFLLSAISYKLFLNHHHKKHGKWLYILAILFFIISTLAKATALVLPGIFVIIYIHSDIDSFKLKTIFRHLLPILPFIYLFVQLNEWANSRNFLVRDFSYSNFEHFIFTGYTYFFYWLKGIFPFPLVFFYPAPSENLAHLPISYFMMFAGSFILVLLMFYHFFKKQNTLFFAVAFYTISILPMLDLIFYPLGDLPMLVSNRYFYHSSLGILLYIVLLTHYYIKNVTLKISLATTYTILLIVLFCIHIPVWKKQILMMENNEKYYPSEEILYKLAMEYDNAGNTEKAFICLDKADKLGTNIWVNNPWPYYQGRSRLYLKAKKYDKSLNDINTALRKKDLKYSGVDSLLEIDKKKIEIAIQLNRNK